MRPFILMVARLSESLPVGLPPILPLCLKNQSAAVSQSPLRWTVSAYAEVLRQPRTEDEAHNLTSNDPVWELVKAADRAVLATATPLKQVAELQGVAKTSVYPIV